MKERHYVNKVIYILIGLFLGGLGFHKLYARRYIAFILYLIFASTGIPEFLAIIDVVVALCRPADAYGFIEA